MARAREILFRIFYSTTFTIVFLVLIAFICVSPADALYFSYKRRRLIDIFLIAGVYIVTALIAILIYASRLYTTRSVLKDIPKTYIPLDKEDLPGTRTWRLISETIKRSAVVAQQTRPRAHRIELEVEGAEERIEKLLRPETRKNGDEMRVPIRWGQISHRGWSSPANNELPELHYETVVAQLMDLIEAKAVSLVPVDLAATPDVVGEPVPDARVIEALTRPGTAGMRQYIAQLIEMEVLEGSELTMAFLTLYERARFAVEPLSELEFKNLMRMFAELLRGMKQVNVDLIDFEAFDDENDGGDEHESIDNDTGGGRDRSRGGQSDNRSLRSKRSLASSHSHFSSASSISGSVRRHAGVLQRQSQDSIRVTPREGDG